MTHLICSYLVRGLTVKVTLLVSILVVIVSYLWLLLKWEGALFNKIDGDLFVLLSITLFSFNYWLFILCVCTGIIVGCYIGKLLAPILNADDDYLVGFIYSIINNLSNLIVNMMKLSDIENKFIINQVNSLLLLLFFYK